MHPVVQPDAERAKEVVEQLNELLAPDGWILRPHKQMSGRPVYAPARTSPGGNPSLTFAHEVATRIDAEHISQQIKRMEGAIDTDPELAIGTAKEFVESICKTILDDRRVAREQASVKAPCSGSRGCWCLRSQPVPARLLARRRRRATA